MRPYLYLSRDIFLYRSGFWRLSFGEILCSWGPCPPESHSDLSAYESIINVLPLFSEYLTGLLWPYHLNLWHAFHPLSLSLRPGDDLRGCICHFFCFAVSAYRKDRVLFFGLLLHSRSTSTCILHKGNLLETFCREIPLLTLCRLCASSGGLFILGQ